jgi:glycosyltransferase involved in cell wall biosynthesis
VVAEHSHAAWAALDSGLPWILDEHNIESDYWASKQLVAGSLRRWHRPELSRLHAWETRCWQRASEVIAVTKNDAAYISQHRARPAQHIPNGADLAELRFMSPSERSGPGVLFVGLMDHPPNVQAAQTLATRVMPLVWQHRPDARLVLCGANPARAVRALAGPRICVTGRVPSLAPYLAEARVFANCLAFGAGSSLKVLEALAAGVPLISTAVGVRGFSLHPGEHYVGAETPQAFAAAILRCLNVPGAAYGELSAMARAGRVFAEAHHWHTLAERFGSLADRKSVV